MTIALLLFGSGGLDTRNESFDSAKPAPFRPAGR
jgi:hypothetical protein